MISDILQRSAVSSPWRWSNIPVPEPYAAGTLLTGALHVARPWRLRGRWRLCSGAGWILLGSGVALAASAWRAASDVDLERPSALVSTGPYAISRNPMYLGWTLLYIGSALLTRNAWMVASLPVVAGIIHRDVLREEHRLARAFGDEYLRYRRLARRYL